MPVTTLAPDLEPDNGTGRSFALRGDDATMFQINTETGAISAQDWFLADVDLVWDRDRDNIYEVTLAAAEADGTETLYHYELVVTDEGATWREAAVAPEEPEVLSGDDTYAGADVEGVTYTLVGADAALFVVDPDTGDVTFQSWYTPSYDEVWDQNRDNIYEMTVVGTDGTGQQVSEQDIELVVTESSVLWQEAGTSPDPSEADPIDAPSDTTHENGETNAPPPSDVAPYLNAETDAALLNTFDAAADLYIDAQGNADAPIFDGSIDWHSSVHAHLANVVAYEVNGDQAGLQAFADARFAAADVEAEIAFNFDDPYGWAWLLKLDTRLQDNGIDHLAPAGEHFAAELEADLNQQLARGTTDNGAGSYNDANWKIANLIQYAQHQGDAAAEARYQEVFDAIQADTNVNGNTSISAGDFFSSLSLSGYAHVVAGATFTTLFQDIHDQMLASITDGSLDQLLDTEGARLDAGIGFSHSAGIAISSAFGYWAMFTETLNPAFYDAYSNVLEWTETYAAQMADGIGPGHWLPNFASFAADLPAQLSVEDPDGTLTADIEEWLSGNGPVSPPDPVDPAATDVVLTGDAGSNALIGGTGNDRLDGLGNRDTLDGGAGDDTLLAGYDDGTGDVFIGGTGTDTYDIQNSTVSQFGFTVDLTTGADQYGNSYEGIENIFGGAGDDAFTGSDDSNMLVGGAGNDRLDGLGNRDTLDGGAGDDTLLAGYDDGTGDVFIGGTGTDTYDIQNSTVSQFGFNVDLATGTDQYGNSYESIENILGGDGDDLLSGDGGDNRLSGGAGDDVLSASAGDDTLVGGSGSDTFRITAEDGGVRIADFGAGSEQDFLDVSGLSPFFSDPMALMAALSFDDGETTFDVDLTDGTRQIIILSEEALEEEDFLF